MQKLTGLRKARERAALTQEELAKRSGVGRATIAGLEAGHRRAQPGTVKKLAGELGVDLEELGEAAARPAAVVSEPAGVGALTAVYELTEDGWWVVSVPEIPGAHSQGENLEEARSMIRDAVRMLLEVRREDAERETEGKKNVVREPLEV